MWCVRPDAGTVNCIRSYGDGSYLESSPFPLSSPRLTGLPRQLKLLFVDLSVEGNLRVVLRANHFAAFLVRMNVLQGKIGLRVDPDRSPKVGSVLPLQANFVFD